VFPLLDISDDDRLSSVLANLARGNHKSARNHEHSLISMLKGEVDRGWQLPLPKEEALVIPGCEVAPLGMVAQTTINKGGEPQRKLRLTHDQSFSPKGSSSRSVNDSVDETTLTPVRFGKAFSRFLYHNSYLRRIKTDEPIYMTKGDFKSAYRRIHLQACTCVDGILLVALRMTFGGRLIRPCGAMFRMWSPTWQMTESDDPIGTRHVTTRRINHCWSRTERRMMTQTER
jgi:hypothetical protein